MHAAAAPSRVRDEAGFLSIPLVGRERGRVLELFCAETHRVPGYRAVPIAIHVHGFVRGLCFNRLREIG